MKIQLYLLLVLQILTSCSNSDSAKEEELALREREIALKERELELKHGSENHLASNDATLESTQTAYTSKKTTQTKGYKSKTEAELREELYETEKSNPKNYLSVDYDLSYKILTGEEKITGTIYNYASIATFKDIELRVTYFSGTETEIKSETYVIYDYVHPGGSTPFIIKTYYPEGTKTIGVKVKTATPD
jgi:hypothetical protein